MMKYFLLCISLFAVILQPLYAQKTFPVNGVYDQREGLYAFTNATIYTTYNQKIEKATLLIRKGRIEAVGNAVTVPKGAVVVDLGGKFIYPSFIDTYTAYGVPEAVKKDMPPGGTPPQFVSDKKGAYGWNQAIKPEIEAVTLFSPDAKAAGSLRELGFGTVLAHQKDGIARGTGVVVVLADLSAQETVIKDRASAHYSFNKGISTQDYPDSQMGAIALLRQTYLDAQWYKQALPTGEEFNLSLDAWNKIQTLPQIFEVNDRLSALRADKIGDEFGVQYIIKGSGDEYQRINEIKATGASLILPLNFPDAYDVADPYAAQNISLSQMKHWELAPANPSFAEKNNIPFALTTANLKNTADFTKKLREAIKRGLSKEAALKALTHTPANMLGIAAQTGSLETGKLANFLICSGDIFDEKTQLFENWVKGQPYILKDMTTPDLRGLYTLKVGSESFKLDVSGETTADTKYQIVLNDTTKIPVSANWQKQSLNLTFAIDKDSLIQSRIGKGLVRLSGYAKPDNSQQWQGSGQLANGKWIDWSAMPRKEEPKKDEKTDKKDKEKQSADKKEENNNNNNKKTEEKPAYGSIPYPFNGYGWTEMPKAEAILFKNATVWTNETEGILSNTDVLIKNGKIEQIGKNISAPAGAKTIDAKDKHLTSGIIDEHSHIAISKGVNEGTQASSAEVRIGDVIDSEDIDIYRQLAGGVTTAHLLHGSANPIGGQTALIKLRWGQAPEKMKFEGADGFIKFALGENVKQANWGDMQTLRYPQSRLGVEQTYTDYFTRALEYGKQRTAPSAAAKGSTAKPFRRDLELEALNEIINKKRFVTCHSYVQSEITMLMRVAEHFGFRINTFTHILEGYKVADKMKQHGASGSSFSDWWAYKVEVYEAIPHNGAIMHEVGVNVGFNSDDAEMARRLNQEAAKAIKYGSVSPEEAWKFVTLNPAKMLHIDNRTGSLKVGKDADVVLWSDNPLSIYARTLQTYVDGVCLYDETRDLEQHELIAKERNRLIQKMIAAKKDGGDTQPAEGKARRHYHCDTEGGIDEQQD